MDVWAGRYFNDSLYAKIADTHRFFEQLLVILDMEVQEYERMQRGGWR